jgi:hypothetical protein
MLRFVAMKVTDSCQQLDRHLTANIKHMDKDLKRLRKQLPYRYASMIALKSKSISVRTVRAVFAGDITNPLTVDKVVSVALKVKREHDKRQRSILEKIKTGNKTTRRAA